MQPTSCLIRIDNPLARLVAVGVVRTSQGSVSEPDVRQAVNRATDSFVEIFAALPEDDPREVRRTTWTEVAGDRSRIRDGNFVSISIGGLVNEDQAAGFEALITRAVAQGLDELEALARIASAVESMSGTSQKWRTTDSRTAPEMGVDGSMHLHDFAAYVALGVADLVHTLQASLPGYDFMDQLRGHLMPSPIDDAFSRMRTNNIAGRTHHNRFLEHDVVSAGNGRNGSS